MSNYDDYQVADAPSWLSDPPGVLWNKVLGTAKNIVVAAAQTAVFMRFASKAPLDALPELLAERALDPPWNEGELSIRKRITRAWATWSEGGRKAAVDEALRLAGYTLFDIREQPQDGTLQWWQFEVYLFPPFPFVDEYLADGRWGDAGVWDDGGVWAADLPVDHIARVRAALKKWPGLHTRCRGIVVVHAGVTWDSDAPPGTWDDDATATWGDDVSYLAP